MAKAAPIIPKVVEPPPPSDGTIKRLAEGTRDKRDGDRTPQGPTDYLGAGDRSVGRGDFDQAIRSMRTAKRRPRAARPLSKIFLDGGSMKM